MVYRKLDTNHNEAKTNTEIEWKWLVNHFCAVNVQNYKSESTLTLIHNQKYDLKGHLIEVVEIFIDNKATFLDKETN